MTGPVWRGAEFQYREALRREAELAARMAAELVICGLPDRARPWAIAMRTLDELVDESISANAA